MQVIFPFSGPESRISIRFAYVLIEIHYGAGLELAPYSNIVSEQVAAQVRRLVPPLC